MFIVAPGFRHVLMIPIVELANFFACSPSSTGMNASICINLNQNNSVFSHVVFEEQRPGAWRLLSYKCPLGGYRDQ